MGYKGLWNEIKLYFMKQQLRREYVIGLGYYLSPNNRTWIVLPCGNKIYRISIWMQKNPRSQFDIEMPGFYQWPLDASERCGLMETFDSSINLLYIIDLRNERVERKMEWNLLPIRFCCSNIYTRTWAIKQRQQSEIERRRRRQKFVFRGALDTTVCERRVEHQERDEKSSLRFTKLSDNMRIWRSPRDAQPLLPLPPFECFLTTWGYKSTHTHNIGS